MSAPSVLSPTDFALLCRVIEIVARRHRLSPVDVEDFSQWAHLHLLERNYEPLARFSGRSSLRTYLTVVVKRLLLDWRNIQQGKWRPAAWARRHGRAAIELDRLVTRDGHTRDEALAILSSSPDAPEPAMLRELAARAVLRRRPRFVHCEDIESLATIDFADHIQAEEAALAQERLRQSLRRAIRQLTPTDRHVLYLRFQKNLTVVAIAERLGNVTAKSLYRRIAAVIASLRRSVEAQGIDVRRCASSAATARIPSPTTP